MTTIDYSDCTEIWWLKSQINYWANKHIFDQFVKDSEVEANINAIKARLKELGEG